MLPHSWAVREHVSSAMFRIIREEIAAVAHALAVRDSYPAAEGRRGCRLKVLTMTARRLALHVLVFLLVTMAITAVTIWLDLGPRVF
jgi:hypothetical protein